MDIPASLKTGSTISAKSFHAVPFPPIGLIIKRTCLGRFVSANGYFLYTCMCLVKQICASWKFHSLTEFLEIPGMWYSYFTKEIHIFSDIIFGNTRIYWIFQYFFTNISWRWSNCATINSIFLKLDPSCSSSWSHLRNQRHR